MMKSGVPVTTLWSQGDLILFAIIRDLLAGRKPLVLRDEIYAVYCKGSEIMKDNETYRKERMECK
ncbi:hypothetical protein [Paenibacillus uliginis]|uniref:hypothetical protein n=1 Tax=Paenibacillus uliginis TaxID=683737 RepID=UPI001FCD66F3|nr:hypothetical protein [Paenibacillus uliginis]